MSEPASALSGANFNGRVRVEEAGLRGMISVRGDLASVALKKAVTGVTGVDFPSDRGANLVEERGILWMSPDELLVLVPYEETESAVATMAEPLKSEHHLVVDVSDARAGFRLTGPDFREVLARLTPTDLNPERFGLSEVRRTRLSQVAVAIWLRSDESAELVCFRSVARYVFDLLSNAARPAAADGIF